MTEPRFNETTYLTLHQDVRQAVARGDFGSGLEHYERYGKAEGRKMMRFDPDSHSIRDYTRLVRHLIASHPENPDLAMAKAIGALTLDIFHETGDKQYQVLCRYGLQDGQAIYDLACGSGRTASALQRHGWNGAYRGADVIPELVDYATQNNPGFRFFVHPDYSIFADDNSQDMIFSWSLFTHLQLEETFLYAKDCLRALKPGGIFVFSFLTLQDRGHRELFQNRITALETGINYVHLDTFLDQATILALCEQMLGLRLIEFIAADDDTLTPGGCFGQALAVFEKATDAAL
jgi:SAM-dependent methyltransferase